jgi:hypothetical protein
MSEIRNEAELQRMLEETKKFVAESHKLEAERRKLDKERWFPWLQEGYAGSEQLVRSFGL